MKNFSELLAMTGEELGRALEVARRDVMRGRMAVKTGQEKNTAKYAEQKKYVARILTAMKEKEISEFSL